MNIDPFFIPQPSHLPEDAPNILIVMLDDAGFGHPNTFGGEIETQTLSRLAEEGISYNRFQTTAMCSSTCAALITGRNHHRVGNGMVAEFANDWDGYTGVIPKSSATIAEVPEGVNGVIFAMGGYAGGMSLLRVQFTVAQARQDQGRYVTGR